MFMANIPLYYLRAQEFIDYINSNDYVTFDISVDTIVESIQDFFSMDNLSASFTALFGVSTVIFRLFLTFISSIYILFEKESFKALISRLLKVFTSSDVYKATMKYGSRLNRNFKQYIFTQTIDGFILGTIATLELLYIIRSPFALTLGIMLGIINYIPYFGSIIGSLIAIVIVMFTQGFAIGAITALVLLVTQQIDGNIIQPRLMGGSFSLSPLVIIISITVGGALAGVLGMIAAIPIVAVLKDILDSIIDYYERKRHDA
jgi:predicted PurR-regulated permease PerM